MKPHLFRVADRNRQWWFIHDGARSLTGRPRYTLKHMWRWWASLFEEPTDGYVRVAGVCTPTVVARRVAKLKREALAEASREPACDAVRRCRVCGCTDADCRECIAATGYPCGWVKGEPALCSRCAAEENPATVLEIEGGAA